LLSQKSEDNREYQRVDQGCWDTSLTRHKDAFGAWWEGQEHTWTECEEERRSHEKICLGKDETHGFRDERECEEEDKGVEHDRGSAGETVSQCDFGTVCSEKNTWTER